MESHGIPTQQASSKLHGWGRAGVNGIRQRLLGYPFFYHSIYVEKDTHWCMEPGCLI